MELEKITTFFEKMYAVVTPEKEMDLKLERLKQLAKVVLDDEMTNNNLTPAAWNIFYQLRESGRITLYPNSKIKPYLAASTFVKLLIELYGPRIPNGSTELVVSFDKKKAKGLMNFANMDFKEGIDALEAFLIEEEEKIQFIRLIFPLMPKLLLAKYAPMILLTVLAQKSVDKAA